MRLVITVVEVKEGKAIKVGALGHMLGSVSERFLKARPSFLSRSLTVKRGPKMERHAYVPLDDVREYFTSITRPLPDTRTFASCIRNKKSVPGCHGFIEYLYSDKFDHATLIEYGGDGQVERLYGVRKENIGIAHSDAWINKYVLGAVDDNVETLKDNIVDSMLEHMDSLAEDTLDEKKEEIKIKVSISELVEEESDEPRVHDVYENVSPRRFVRAYGGTKSGKSVGAEDEAVVSQDAFIVAIKSYLEPTPYIVSEAAKRIISVKEDGDWSVKDMRVSSEFIDLLKSEKTSAISLKEFGWDSKLITDFKVVPEHGDFSPFVTGIMEVEEEFMKSSKDAWEESRSSPNMVGMHAPKEWVKIRVLDYICNQGKEVHPKKLLNLGSSNGLFHLDSVESVIRKDLEAMGQGAASITYLGRGSYVTGHERFMTAMLSGIERAALVMLDMDGRHLKTVMFENHDSYGLGISWANWYEDVLLNVPTVVNTIKKNKGGSRDLADGWGSPRYVGQGDSRGSLPVGSSYSACPSATQGQDTPASGTAGHIKSMYVDERGKVMVMSGGQWVEYKGNPMDVLMKLVAKRG